IYCNDSLQVSSVFRYCTFEEGYGVLQSGGNFYFCGALTVDNSIVIIDNCIFQDQIWISLEIQSNSEVVITNSIFKDTGSNTNHYAIYSTNSEVEIINSKISNNYNGIFCAETSMNVIDCIILDNHWYGIYFQYCEPKILNCTIVGNNKGMFSFNNTNEFYRAQLINSIFWDNIINIGGGWWGTTERFFDVYNSFIDVNPEFINEIDRNLHLSASSPGIDIGIMDLPFGLELPEFDLDGNPRIIGLAVDMGAYETQ
ncbi:MAG: right-handed parallel beta-helix repeat-containing protein, partial [Candidatus Cloacimonetes bacterium]|nr:right-handed parallel beta-helix repeat-containing protein [Candidatus Cloacimonadota bacterium]